MSKMCEGSMNLFPNEWIGTDHEKELNKELNINEFAEVIVDSQFDDSKERSIGKIGQVAEINPSDGWSYKLRFSDGSSNWFKRYHLEKYLSLYITNDVGDKENKKFFINKFKNIIMTNDIYRLQDVFRSYEKDQNILIETRENHKNKTDNGLFSAKEKDCTLCIHCMGYYCNILDELFTMPENCHKRITMVNNCDAYYPLDHLNIIKSKDEMIKFIELTENFFSSEEDYEEYYGFARRFDEETGKIIETVREYYLRGGNFENIPNKFPCVIYFDYGKGKLQWKNL